MGAGKSGFFKNTKGALDTISDLLVAASFIPAADMITNAISVPVDLLRGDYVSAGLSALGVIPYIGEAGDAAKVARVADKASDATKVVQKGTKTINAIKKVSPYQLTQTHRLTLGKREYSNLVDSIRKNGITESIKYVEYKGKKYVVDGHHRLRAAKQLQLKEIPVERVTLPYKGYRNIQDLLDYD